MKNIKHPIELSEVELTILKESLEYTILHSDELSTYDRSRRYGRRNEKRLFSLLKRVIKIADGSLFERLDELNVRRRYISGFPKDKN